MCYNCGCGAKDDPMGKKEVEEGGSLTEKSFAHLAKEWNMTTEEAKRNTYELLKQEFEK